MLKTLKEQLAETELELAAEAKKRVARLLEWENRIQEVEEEPTEDAQENGATAPVILCANCLKNLPNRLCTEDNSQLVRCNAPLCSECPKHDFHTTIQPIMSSSAILNFPPMPSAPPRSLTTGSFKPNISPISKTTRSVAGDIVARPKSMMYRKL